LVATGTCGKMASMKDDSAVEEVFASFAGKISQATGSFWTFSAAVLVVLVWAATGPVFHYSETWQLVINTGTTIVTFLMVFIIQHAQNKDMRAVHLKLNELIAAVEGASNRLIDVEDLSDHELEHLYSRFQTLAKTAEKVSHGAKLTIEDSDDDQANDDAGHGHGHTESEADKKPVKVKREAKHRKKTRR
jgi:low affinity Fe/Cu permease